MPRKLISVGETSEALDATEFAEDPRSWLSARVAQLGRCVLLAHADDGVIWGVVDGERCVVGRDLAPRVGDYRAPSLSTETLQTLRAFNQRGEVLVWRAGDGWRARAIGPADGGGLESPREAFDERQILWGTIGESVGDGSFVLLSDGRQGLRHLIPLPTAVGRLEGKRVCLVVRHYLAADATGQVSFVESRLLTLSLENVHA